MESERSVEGAMKTIGQKRKRSKGLAADTEGVRKR